MVGYAVTGLLGIIIGALLAAAAIRIWLQIKP